MDTGVTSTELVELAALEALEPDLGDRIDAGFAQVMALIYNRTRGKTERGRKPQDFMPKWGPVDHDAIERKLRAGIEMMREVRHGQTGT
jgi:hypothetical protein